MAILTQTSTWSGPRVFGAEIEQVVHSRDGGDHQFDLFSGADEREAEPHQAAPSSTITTET